MEMIIDVLFLIILGFIIKQYTEKEQYHLNCLIALITALIIKIFQFNFNAIHFEFFILGIITLHFINPFLFSIFYSDWSYEDVLDTDEEMKRTGYNYKTYWCESEECYFKINSTDRTARQSSQLKAINDNDRDLRYPTYVCRGDINLEDYLDEDDEIDFQTLKIDSKDEN